MLYMLYGLTAFGLVAIAFIYSVVADGTADDQPDVPPSDRPGITGRDPRATTGPTRGTALGPH